MKLIYSFTLSAVAALFSQLGSAVMYLEPLMVRAPVSDENDKSQCTSQSRNEIEARQNGARFKRDRNKRETLLDQPYLVTFRNPISMQPNKKYSVYKEENRKGELEQNKILKLQAKVVERSRRQSDDSPNTFNRFSNLYGRPSQFDTTPKTNRFKFRYPSLQHPVATAPSSSPTNETICLLRKLCSENL